MRIGILIFTPEHLQASCFWFLEVLQFSPRVVWLPKFPFRCCSFPKLAFNSVELRRLRECYRVSFALKISEGACIRARCMVEKVLQSGNQPGTVTSTIVALNHLEASEVIVSYEFACDLWRGSGRSSHCSMIPMKI